MVKWIRKQINRCWWKLYHLSREKLQIQEKVRVVHYNTVEIRSEHSVSEIDTKYLPKDVIDRQVRLELHKNMIEYLRKINAIEIFKSEPNPSNNFTTKYEARLFLRVRDENS